MRLCRTGMAGVSVRVKSGVFLMVGGWLAPSDWAHAVPITGLISRRKLTQPCTKATRTASTRPTARRTEPPRRRRSLLGHRVRPSGRRRGAAVRRRAARRRRPRRCWPGLPGHCPRQDSRGRGAAVRRRAACRCQPAGRCPGVPGHRVRPSGRRRGAAVRRRAARRRRSGRCWPGLPGHCPRPGGRRRGAPFSRRAVRGPCDAVTQETGTSQVSRGLAGRYRTMASKPDIWRDADLPIRIPAHTPDARH